MPDSRNPLDLEFWLLEMGLLWDTVSGLAMAALLAGIEAGARLLPAGATQVINWDFVNRAALEYLHGYKLDIIAGINETTRQEAIRLIDEWLRGGGHLDGLKRNLEPLFGDTRAARIAITE